MSARSTPAVTSVLFRRCAGVLVLGWISATAIAQESTLAWKLKAGDTFQVSREQQTVSHTTVTNKPVRTSVETTAVMTWTVDAVDGDGVATITQSLDQIIVKLDGGSGLVECDTSKNEKPTGVVKTLADAVLPLIGGKFVVTMTPRGEIKSLTPSETLVKLFSGKKEKASSEAFSTEGIAKLLQQPLVLLPEKPVEIGATWELQRTLASSLGPLQQTLTYSLVGFGEAEQPSNVAQIKIVGTIAPPASSAAGAPKLKSNDLTGAAQFDIETGRLVEMTARQLIELTVIYANSLLNTKTESRLITRLKK